MTHRPLGRTGVQVSPLCLGAMMFGAWGNPDHDESIRIIHRALDAGINFIDTADVYSRGESEEIVGKALEGRRDDVVLADRVIVLVDGIVSSDIHIDLGERRSPGDPRFAALRTRLLAELGVEDDHEALSDHQERKAAS